jgi:hypothetical protein
LLLFDDVKLRLKQALENGSTSRRLVYFSLTIILGRFALFLSRHTNCRSLHSTTKGSFMKKWMIVFAILAVCFIGIQFIRPAIPHPPVTGDFTPPPAVAAIFHRSCYDCHSNQTQLKWFDEVNPAYWMVARHVKEARAALNFSNWDSLAKPDQKSALYLSLNQILFKAMPLSAYTALHTDARLRDEDIKVLKDYVTGLTPSKTSDTARFSAGLKQYAKWQAGELALAKSAIKPSPNGIQYVSGYKDWQAISTTDRFDNGTMRVIFGNATAVKAIKSGHTNPWPDGTIFAKVAWEQLQDSAGAVIPGEFKQVEFMIKDAKQYADTKGWGWARWKTDKLAPYGKNALLATECINCHRPFKDEDFVFTEPIGTKPAAQPSNLHFDPLSWKVITSSINKSTHTMATLYGNDVAVQYARAHADGNYPSGAQLSLVTWKQSADDHWFGANTPNAVQSVELVKFPVSYESYSGQPLQSDNVDKQTALARIDYITKQKSLVLLN